MKKIDLTRIELPDEHEVRERAWQVISRAYLEHEPQPVARSYRRPLVLAVALVAVGTLIGVAVSPAGSSIVHSVREAVGISKAAPALTRLPTAGQLLVSSDEGPWIVQPDGSKRLLGDYEQASWSPHGLFVAVTEKHELLAVDPHGTVRWSLARPGTISLPRWSPDGYRIAYLDRSTLRVVNGDGTDDRRFAGAVAHVAPAWQPNPHNRHIFAFVSSSKELYLERRQQRADCTPPPTRAAVRAALDDRRETARRRRRPPDHRLQRSRPAARLDPPQPDGGECRDRTR